MAEAVYGSKTCVCMSWEIKVESFVTVCCAEKRMKTNEWKETVLVSFEKVC